MLSAFTARPLLELKQRDKSKIESVLLQGDRLFVGLSTGSLRIYRVNDVASRTPDAGSKQESTTKPATASVKPTELLREQEKFSRYGISHLAVIKEANILISLSNYQVSFHDLSSYEPQETLAKTKGASTFAVTSYIVQDEKTKVPEIVSRLAVAVKRKLLVWEWRDSSMTSDEKEFTLGANIRSISWVSGTRAVLGLGSYFVIFDIETSKSTDISGPGAIGGPSTQEGSRFSGVGVSSLMGGLGPMPLATRLGEGEVLLAKDINTHFVSLDGESLGRRQVPWHQAPDAISYSYPFLLALNTSRGTIEVRNPETLTALQTVDVPSAKMVHVPDPGVSLAHAGKGFVVASERSVWKMSALGYDAQIDALVAASQWDEALSLLNMLEDALLRNKTARIAEIQMLKAEDLFKAKKYQQSLDLFTKAKAPPSRVIRLFPPVISGDDSAADESSEDQSEADANTSRKDEEAETKSLGTKAETASIVGSIRRSLIGTLTSKSNAKKVPSLGDKDLKNAARELSTFLVSTRTRIKGVLGFDGNFIDSKRYQDFSAEEQSMIRHLEEYGDRGVDDDDDGDDDDNEDILERLRRVAKLVDSTLFRCYMFASPNLAGSLFRLPNFIDAEVVDEKLLESQRYSDLVDFFHGKGMHESALELLTNIGKGEYEGKNVPDSLLGPQRIVTYLETLSSESIDLILRFIDWPMHTNPDLAMEVFTGNGGNAEKLPRQQVLEYLQTVSSARAAEYLEYVIEEFNEKQPEIHHRLIEIYLQSIQTANDNSEEKERQKIKLLTFIKSSRHYEPWRMVRLLQKDNADVHEMRAVMLGRMGQHKQALEVYVFDMNDISKAEDYCNEAWLEQQFQVQTGTPSTSRPTSKHASSTAPSGSSDTDKPTPYLILLSLLLTQRPPRKTQLGPALDLLARHGARLPASATLNLIPEHISVADVEAYFQARMRASNTMASMAKMAAGLRKTVDDNSNAALRLGDEKEVGVPGAGKARNRSVIVHDDSICRVCRKRFGATAIKILPDRDEAVHYGCAIR